MGATVTSQPNPVRQINRRCGTHQPKAFRDASTELLQVIELGRKDSNLRVADPKSAALPLGDSPEPGRSYRGYAPAAVDANASVAVSGVMTARTSHSWSTPRNSLGVSICGMWPESSSST